MKRVLIALLCFLQIITITTGKYIPQKNFGQGFWPMELGIKQNPNGDKIMNYYDFNHDKTTDIVTVTKIDGRQYLSLYVWVSQTNQFTRAIQSSSGFAQILSVLSTDFEMDGDADLILFTRNLQDEQFKYWIWSLTVKCTKYLCKIQDSQWKYPFYGEQKIDSSFPFLITLSDKPALIVSESSVLKALLWQNGNITKSDFKSSTYFQYDQSAVRSQQIGARLQYHYYGDFDGDCKADLVFMTQSQSRQKSIFQFFQGISASKFKPLQTVEYLNYINHFTMSDVSNSYFMLDFDGRIDLITLFNDHEGKAKTAIHYHKYGFSDLCSSFLQQNQNQIKQKTPYDFSPQNSAEEIKQFNSYHLVNGFKVNPLQSVLRLGDYDNDGYTDMTVTLENVQDGSFRSFLFHNQQCQGQTCGNLNQNFISKAKTLDIRYFKNRTLNSQLQKNKSQFIQSISFFDIYEDGVFDFFVNTIQVNSLANQKKYSIKPIFNNIRVDAFFMKFLLYDGKSKNIKENGVLNGGNIQFYATLLSGDSTPLTENQLPQYSGRTLQLPYILVGIGRTNNYAEEITVTYPYQGENTKYWTPVIPNSQIFIIPPRQGISQKWLMSTFISPTGALANVFWLVVVSLLAIGCVIVYQTRKQKQIDKEDQDVYFSTLK